MLEHGGDIRRAAKHYDIALDEWLDLSTGINPCAWPVPGPSADSWHHLPSQDDGLIERACAYYGAKHCLAVAGSQVAIQALPRLKLLPAGRRLRVGILQPSYAEHAHAWQRQGHEVIAIGTAGIDTQISALDILVLVNPNNPTGELFEIRQLLDWHQRLTSAGGYLIVDEAFMDVTPQHSLAAYCDQSGLIVLRSVGKFFGLAGARCGFVLAAQALLDELQEEIGPWNVSGPTREAVSLAFADRPWQQATIADLERRSAKLAQVLTQCGLAPDGGCALFQWVRHPQAEQIRDLLAQNGLWVRYFSRPASLRFGLPGSEETWQRLHQALAEALPRAAT